MTSSTFDLIDVPDLEAALLEHAAYASGPPRSEPGETAPEDGRLERALPARVFRSYRAAFMIRSRQGIGILLLTFLGFTASTLFLILELLLSLTRNHGEGIPLLPVGVVVGLQILFFWLPMFLWEGKVSDDHRPGPPSSVELARAYADPPGRLDRLAIRFVCFWIVFWSPSPCRMSPRPVGSRPGSSPLGALR